MELQQIWELAQRLLEEGRDRGEVEARVAELTQQATGTRMGLDLLAIQVGESPVQKALDMSPVEAGAALGEFAKQAPQLARVLFGAVRGLPKAIVDQLAEEGPGAIVDAAKAVGNFVVEDVGRHGPGALVDIPGGAAGVGPLRKGKKIAGAVDESVEAAIKRGELVRRPDGEVVSRELDESLRRQARGVQQDPIGGFVPSGELAQLPDGTVVSREFAESNARQQATMGASAQAGARGRSGVRPVDPSLPVLERVEEVRKNYMAAKGYDDVPIPQLGPGDTDEAFHKKWAEIYDRAGKDVNPETEAAWGAMVREVEEQAEWLQRAPEDGGAGIRFDMVTDDPYTSHAEMLKDLEETGSIKVYKTPKERVVEGAGEGGIGSIPPDRIGGTEDVLDFHPLISPEANDLFRGIHDVLGHGVGRNTFDLHGETQAAWQHMAMFSPEARPAVAVETLGQNSAFYHGARPNMFQEQKVFMPHDEKLFGIGYQNLDDVPAAVVPPKAQAPGPELAAAGDEALEFADDAGETVMRLTTEGGGSTVDPRTGQSQAGRDVYAVSQGSDFERLSDEMFTGPEYDAFVAGHADYLRENPNVVVGTWDDRVTKDAHGQVELNLTRLFDSQGEARNFALDNDQWGFGNLADPRLQDPATAGDAFAAADDSFAQARNRLYLDETVPDRRIRREAEYRKNASPEVLEAFDHGPSGRPRPQSQKDEILRNYSIMPGTEEGASFALVGIEGARYYQSGGEGMIRMFGEDAPRFLSVKAALSPNVADSKSSLGALELWADWVDAGRPQNREWMDTALDAMATKYGLTNHNLNNLERSLTVDAARLLEPDILKRGGLVLGFPKGEGVQAGKDVLSGLKVSPYYGNLMGELQRLVMDTHVRGSVGTASGNAARKMEVLGATPKFQEYADFLTETTGHPWTVAEVQAGQWGVTIALKNLAKKRMEARLGRGIRPGEQPEAFRGVPEMLEEMGLEAQEGFSGLQSALGMEELAEEIRKAPNIMETFRSDDAQPLLRRLGIETPEPVSDMSKLAGFLDDPEVRLGDIMDMAKRIAQSTGDSLPGVIAMLLGQGIMDRANGRELIEALSGQAGLDGVNNVGEAYDLNPGGTMELLMLMGEQPGIEDAGLQRFGDALNIQQAPDLIRTLRGSAADPEPAGRSANIRRFGPQAGRRAPVSPVAPPPPIPRPTF